MRKGANYVYVFKDGEMSNICEQHFQFHYFELFMKTDVDVYSDNYVIIGFVRCSMLFVLKYCCLLTRPTTLLYNKENLQTFCNTSMLLTYISKLEKKREKRENSYRKMKRSPEERLIQVHGNLFIFSTITDVFLNQKRVNVNINSCWNVRVLHNLPPY